MRKVIMMAAIGGFLSTTAVQAANTSGLPDYPASPEYQRTYQREQYWKNQDIDSRAKIVTEVKCSDYPIAAEYRRADRRMGLNKKCND